VCAASGPTLEWLADAHGIVFQVLEGFLYPGHSVARMHAVAEKTGAGLMGRLAQSAERAGVTLLTEAQVTSLYADADRITGLRLQRPDGTHEDIGCDTLLLACNGYGGNRAMVQQYIPEIAAATYAGHTGNQGDAVLWGQALGAQIADMGAYQGHGSWAIPHGALVTWAVMMEGGIQVNAAGQRFWNEHEGYSEASQHVIAQPGGLAWNLYDERLHRLAMSFPDYAELFKTGAIKCSETLGGIASQAGMPEGALVSTVSGVHAMQKGTQTCPFGRDFTAKPALQAPYYAVKVTGALFHTQGGLAIDAQARVLRQDGTPFPNLYAGGGAARGLSGAHVWGYLSGNGLLSAVTLGRIAALDIARRREGLNTA
jgi:fumarate reductase flavoprotein subunit